MAVWNKLQALVFGGAIGAAGSVAIEAQIEPARQLAWSNNQFKILDPATVAEMVAQGLTSHDIATAEAALNGVNENRVNALVQLALEAVPVAEALELWRRGEFGDPTSAAAIAKVDHALAKEKIEKQYWEPIKHLFNGRLAPPVIALAIVRGIMDDPGFLPVGPPTTEGKVKAFPKSDLHTLDEARAAGINRERLFVETAIAGRPMGPESAAHATFRKIIEKVDYQRAIAEGDVRNEWAEAIFEATRAIPSPVNFVEGRLRGWIPDAAMNAGTARHGMSEEDTHLLFQIHGRPPSWHQVWIGLQRGGTFDGPTNIIHPAFLKALQESDLRPEWYNLLWHSRFTKPSPFVLRALTADGTFTAAQSEQDLLEIGWEPDAARQAALHWAGSTAAAKQDPYIGKAQTQLWTATHKAYIGGAIDQATADSYLTNLIDNATDRAVVIELWTTELNLEGRAGPPA